MAKPLNHDAKISLRLSADILAALDGLLRPGETRQDAIRAAIEREVTKRTKGTEQ